MMKYIKNIAPTLIILLSVYLNVQVAIAQTQTVSLGQRYAVNGKVVENPWGGVSRQLTGWETLMVLYGGYTFNTGGPTAAQITESSCPNGSVLVGFNLYNMGSNYSTSGSLYCRPVTFSSTLPSFDFSLGHGGNKTVVAGTDVVNSVTATLSSGNPKDVNLSVASIVNASNQNVMDQTNGIFVPLTNAFSVPSVNPTGSSELRLNTQATTPAGTYTVTVRGVSLGTTNTSTGLIIPCQSFKDDTSFPSTAVYQITCSGYMAGNSTLSELLTQDESQLYAAATSVSGVQSSINGMLNRLCDDGDDGLRNSSDSVKYVGGSILNNYPNLELYTPVRTNITWGVTSYAACGKTITSSPINYQIASVPGNEYEIRLISGGGGSTGGVTKTTSFTVTVTSDPYNPVITNSSASCYPAELSQTVTWNAYPGATSYNVYPKRGDTILSTVSTTSPKHIEKPTISGKLYTYEIAAVVGGVEQARSKPVSLDSPSLNTNCPSPSPSGGGGGGTLITSCSVSPTSIIAGQNTTVTITGTASGGSGYQYSFDQGRSFSSNNVKQVTTSTGGEYTMIVRSTGNADTPAISCGTVTVKSLKLWLGKKTNTTLSNGGFVKLKAKKGETVYINTSGSAGLTACLWVGSGWGAAAISNPLAVQNRPVDTTNIGTYPMTMTCQDNGSPISDSVILEVVSSSIEEK